MTTIIKRFYTVVGNVTLDHVRQQNANGARWVQNIDSAAKNEEFANPAFKKLKIKGAHAHKSHKDQSETQDVISAQFLTEDEIRLKSVHVREDGTVKPSK